MVPALRKLRDVLGIGLAWGAVWALAGVAWASVAMVRLAGERDARREHTMS
jgi:hypothetical protein